MIDLSKFVLTQTFHRKTFRKLLQGLRPNSYGCDYASTRGSEPAFHPHLWPMKMTRCCTPSPPRRRAVSPFHKKPRGGSGRGESEPSSRINCAICVRHTGRLYRRLQVRTPTMPMSRLCSLASRHRNSFSCPPTMVMGCTCQPRSALGCATSTKTTGFLSSTMCANHGALFRSCGGIYSSKCSAAGPLQEALEELLKCMRTRTTKMAFRCVIQVTRFHHRFNFKDIGY